MLGVAVTGLIFIPLPSLFPGCFPRTRGLRNTDWEVWPSSLVLRCPQHSEQQFPGLRGSGASSLKLLPLTLHPVHQALPLSGSREGWAGPVWSSPLPPRENRDTAFCSIPLRQPYFCRDPILDVAGVALGSSSLSFSSSDWPALHHQQLGLGNPHGDSDSGWSGSVSGIPNMHPRYSLWQLRAQSLQFHFY